MPKKIQGNFSRLVVENIVDLLALTGKDKQYVTVRGYYSISDGGGGTFFYNSTDTSTSDGGKIFGSGTGRWFRQIEGVLTAKQYGAKGDGVTDDTAFIQALSLNNLKCYVSNDSYLMTGKVSIRANQIWEMNNPEFKLNGTNFVTIFEADDVNEWGILGRTRCVGTLVTGADVGAEIGLVVKGCQRYRVEGFTARAMRSHGIHLQAGTLAPAPRGDQGQWSDCSANESRLGLQIDTDTSIEFNTFTNFNANGNLNGIDIGAGNNTFVGGNIVDNSLGGVLLSNGSNHGHGIMSGVNINHNAAYNIKAVSVTNGFTFSGCHFYGNGGLTCPIWFENSKGLHIEGGTIDSAIYNDGSTGINTISKNFVASTTPTLNGTNPEMLRILGNWDENGSWLNNDSASEYTLVSRSSSTLAISPATVIVFNNAEKDKRTDYNVSTGDYTAPIAGVLRIKAVFEIGATGVTTNSYIEFKKGGVIFATAPVVFVSSTLSFGVIDIDVIVATGDVITMVSQASGTSPLLNIIRSKASFSIE
jgi:hypothetical protein